MRCSLGLCGFWSCPFVPSVTRFLFVYSVLGVDAFIGAVLYDSLPLFPLYAWVDALLAGTIYDSLSLGRLWFGLLHGFMRLLLWQPLPR